MNRVIFQGDVLERLAEMDSESIDCIISSPPYWGLRDYGVEGQLGLEPDFRDYLKTMNGIMVQLKRVLKNTGTCWINLGDTYGYNSGKSRYGIPERFYINCIDDGWIARNHIPWYKANAMPSSVKDRFANKWESIFFFTKQQKYYFDLDAVREKTITESKPFNVRVRDSPKGKYGSLFSATEDEIANHNSKGERKMLSVGGQSTQGIHRSRNDGKDDWEYTSKGKNPGDVFFINPRPFPEAHFATFPVDLPTKILKCACPKDGIVLDPFFGSGTVGVAAEQLGLKWCGIELNEEYIGIANKRLDQYRNNSLEMFT
jgi:DNA modification methylase